MFTPTTRGRLLAIAAGIVFAGGGLTILLGEELLHPFSWTAVQWLTILTVAGTIAAGHLAAEAIVAKHWPGAAGFSMLFVVGTFLVVYSSVGRQVESAGVTTMSVEDANARLEDLHEERKRAVARREYAEQKEAWEIAGRPDKRGRPTGPIGCGKNCLDWRQNSKDVTAAIEKIDREIEKIGPRKPVNAQAAAFADMAALFGLTNKARTIAFLTLLWPFLRTLFFEIGAIVSLGFAFRMRPAPAKAQPLPEKTFSEIKAEALAKVDPSPLTAMFSGDLPEPTPPKGGRKSRKPLPANVVDFPGKHAVEQALEANGGSVASNHELASLMQVSDGEASKRWQEIAHRLDVRREGRQVRLALKR